MELRISEIGGWRTFDFGGILEFVFGVVFLVVGFDIVGYFDGGLELDERDGFKEVMLGDI